MFAATEPTAFRDACLQADTLCFYGLGTLFHDCYPQLVLAAGRRPDLVSDRQAEKWKQHYDGVPCVSPEALFARPGRTVILMCMRNAEAIGSAFAEHGCQVFLAGFKRNLHAVQKIDSLATVKQLGVEAKPRLLDPSGKWVLVTGASRGLGRHIAVGLARLGANLVLHARSPEHLAETSALCSGFGVRVHPMAADFGKTDDIDGFLAQLGAFDHPIDFLYNNAGISPSNYADFWHMPAEAFATAMAVNAIAPIRLCQHLIPAMKTRGFGRIINVSSSIQSRPGEMAYACSKAALDKFVADIRDTLAGSGVMISLLDPGWLRTDMGGPHAPFAAESALPGALLPALIDADIHGQWISAQDYAGMRLEDAARKALAMSIGTAPTRLHP